MFRQPSQVLYLTLHSCHINVLLFTDCFLLCSYCVVIDLAIVFLLFTDCFSIVCIVLLFFNRMVYEIKIRY